MEQIEKINISPDVVAREVGDETVILHLGSGTYFGLDSAGARIWQLMGEGKSPAEICDVLLEEYEVPREQLERDITGFVEDLLAQGLITA